MSLFSKMLKELLDDTVVFDRGQWASVLSVKEGVIDSWLEDECLPSPRHLLLIINVLKVASDSCKLKGEAFQKRFHPLVKFEWIGTRSADILSPLGEAMLPNIVTYMFRPVKAEIKHLKPENIKPPLKDRV